MYGQLDPTRVTLALSRPVGPDGPGSFRLVITDVPSRMPIAEITLTPEQFADLMSGDLAGSVDGAEAQVLTAPQRYTIGAHRFRVSRRLTDVPDDDALEKWAKTTARSMGTIHRIQRSHGGTTVTWYAWFESEEDGQAWERETTVENHPLPWERDTTTPSTRT